VDPTLIRFAESRLGGKALEVEEVHDHHVHSSRILQVGSSSKIQVANEKLASKLAVWDALTPLEPNTEGVREIIEEACRRVEIKPTKELVQSVQWRLFEGSGGINDVEASCLEAMQWVMLPQDPKPELPWFNPEGFIRLSQTYRELKGYQALLSGDLETAKLLGVRERALKWNLDPSGVERSRGVLDRWAEGLYEEDAAKTLLRAIWAPLTIKRKRT
jgi:hypothetical protein